MKPGKSGRGKVLRLLEKNDAAPPSVKVIPGPARIPRRVIRKAVHDVLKAHLEQELGRPVTNAEMRRDPKLPPIVHAPYAVRLDPYWARKEAQRAAKGKKAGKAPKR